MRTGFKIVATAAALSLSFVTSAFAQALPFDWRNEVPDRNDAFTRCMHRDRANAETTIRNCDRVIAERASVSYTAAAYYSRGLMREMLQDRESAREDFGRAYEYFTIAIGSTGRHTDSYRNRAATLYRLGRYEESVADYRTSLAVVTNARDDSGTRVRSGVAELRRNQVSGLHYRIGGVQFKAGDWGASLAAFDEAIRIAPEVAVYHAGRCEALAAAKSDFGAARTACERAVQLSEARAYALFSAGFLTFSQDNFAEAFDLFSAAYQHDDQNHLALYGRGATAVRLGRAAEGEADITQATQQIDASALEYYSNAGLRASNAQ